METDLSPILSFVIFTGLDALGPIIALILILVRASGRIRTVGVIGSVLLILGTIGSGLLALLLPMLQRATGLSVSSVGLLLVPPGLIAELGTLGLGIAVIIGTVSRPVRGGSSPNEGGGTRG